MIGEFEKYHGVVLRRIVAEAVGEVGIRSLPVRVGIRSFLLNGKFAIYIKHSSKRLPPWQFTFNPEHREDIHALCGRARLWIVLVCGFDGILTLPADEVSALLGSEAVNTSFIRVDRGRRKMYRISGSAGMLSRSKAEGITDLGAAIIE